MQTRMNMARLSLLLVFVVFCQCGAKDAQGPHWRYKTATGTWGQTAKLPCISASKPTFRNNDKEVIYSEKYLLINEGDRQLYTLVIKFLSAEDHGTYYCVAGGMNDTMDLNLRIYIKPPELNYDIKIGMKGTVPVVVHGAPRPFLVQWDKKVDGGSYKQLLKLEDNVLSGPEAKTGRMAIDRKKGFLIINNVMESDTGEYRILAETAYEAFEKTTHITAK